MRNTEFAVNEIYHVYNRGVDKRPIFSDAKDFKRFRDCMVLLNSDSVINSVRDYNKNHDYRHLVSGEHKIHNEGSNLVNFVSFCLLPNHFHFILKQNTENGIERFMHKLSMSYSKYFNAKHQRSGSLLQGAYKSKHVDSNEYLLWLSVYVNLNDKVHRISNNDSTFIYSSWDQIVGKETKPLVSVNPNIITDQYQTIDEYKEFALETLTIIRQNKAEQKRSEFEK